MNSDNRTDVCNFSSLGCPAITSNDSGQKDGRVWGGGGGGSARTQFQEAFGSCLDEWMGLPPSQDNQTFNYRGTEYMYIKYAYLIWLTDLCFNSSC